jgi:ribosomal-protein-alanine N-acetyltransferase
MKLDYSLFSKRLFFRTLTKKDVGEKYLNWLKDNKVTRFLETRFENQTKKEIITYVKKSIKSNDTLLLGIFLKDQNIHIGNIKICSISWHHKHCTLGILIGDRQAHNQGYATETILRISQFCRNRLKMQKVCAGLYKNNIASKKAFKKAGFIVEGVQKQHWKEQNKRVDGLLMAKTF